ncbi:hypothetical protein A0H81_14451 [Grifola frondosa]|uniref:Uncharacterized protein n=1 Tax=Grifola frondosa TaxID=5627 RepID=A0A1C7LLG2_GRIFR|nr:hypothetical protein A0H81_14451 [Grifola frondosa]
MRRHMPNLYLNHTVDTLRPSLQSFNGLYAHTPRMTCCSQTTAPLTLQLVVGVTAALLFIRPIRRALHRKWEMEAVLGAAPVSRLWTTRRLLVFRST